MPGNRERRAARKAKRREEDSFVGVDWTTCDLCGVRFGFEHSVAVAKKLICPSCLGRGGLFLARTVRFVETMAKRGCERPLPEELGEDELSCGRCSSCAARKLLERPRNAKADGDMGSRYYGEVYK